MKIHIPNTLRLATALILLAASNVACTQTRSIEFKQVSVGFNGPKYPKAYFFEGKAAADTSWIKSALPKDKYDEILSKIDFDHQALIAFAVGEREAASGVVKISRMFQYRGKDYPTNISVLVGIRGADCGEKKGIVSYPFVVAILDKPGDFRPYGGFDSSNFSDGCGVEMRGDPTEVAHQ